MNWVGRWQLEKDVDVRHPGALGAKSQDLGSNSGHFRITPDSSIRVLLFDGTVRSSPSIPHADIMDEIIAGDILLASVPAKAH